MRSRLFETEYRNDLCPCGEPIAVGDNAGFVDDELTCEECWNNAGGMTADGLAL